jgi:hypothetical protein
MDGMGLVWMTPSQLGKRSRLGFGFGAGLIGLEFPWKNLSIIVDICFQRRG